MKKTTIYIILTFITVSLFSNKTFGQIDISLAAIMKSDTACLVSPTDTIQIMINNNNSDPDIDGVTNFPVSYQRLDGNIVTEVFTDTIQPGSSTVYTFSQTVNLSKSWNTGIRAWTDLQNDTNLQNDTAVLNLNCQCVDSIGTPYVCNQVVVQYVDNISAVSLGQLRDSIINAGGHLLDSINCGIRLDWWSLPHLFHWNGTNSIGAESHGEELETSTAGIEEADLNYIADTLGFSKKRNKAFVNQFPYRIGNTQQRLSTIPTVRIITLDTGFDLESPIPSTILIDSICLICGGLSQTVSGGFDFINMDSDPTDDHGHGTNVTNVMLDVADDLGFIDFKVTPIKVLDHQGQGSLWNIALGMLAAKSLNADIVNVSFGWTGSRSEILDTLIQMIGEGCHGLLVTSAGNKNENNDLIPHYPSNATLFYDNVVAVGALNSANSKASYSNYGTNSVDIAAPGDIFQNNVVVGSGTSYAAPFVAIRAAIKMAENEHISAAQIKSCLKSIYNQGVFPLIDSMGNVQIYNVFEPDGIGAFERCSDTLTGNSTCIREGCNNPNNSNRIIELMPYILAYPNPFNDNINFDISFDEPTTIYFRIFDIRGRSVFEYEQTSEEHQIKWNGMFKGKQLSAGIYFGHLLTDKVSHTIKLLKLE